MSPLQTLIRMLGGQARKPGRLAIYFTMATTSLKIVRRIMSNRQRTLLQFQVKPGEVYEVRGIRRGR